MPGDIKEKYASPAAITLSSLDSLADGSSDTSSEIDNSSNLYKDILVVVTITTGSGTGGSGVIRVFAVASTDSLYPDGANEELRPIGTFNANSDSSIFRQTGMSVAQAFGGTMPSACKIVVKNDSGAALAGSGNSAAYEGSLNQYT